MGSVGLSCSCGRLRGRVSDVETRRVNRLVCYCDDCQAFGKFLGRADILDAHGGSDICQMSSAQVRFDHIGNLGCTRLSAKGLLRWYSTCCNTPIANTMASTGLPFAGVSRHVLGVPDGALDAMIGAPRARVNLKFATGDASHLDKGVGMVAVIANFARIMLAARLRGDHKLSGFFEGADPVVAPQTISGLIRD